MIRRLQPIFSALRFLTILPVPEAWCGDMESFKKSANWFPIVGLILGLLTALCDAFLRWLVPLPVACALLLVVIIALNGALHLDGLADSADAFFSSRGRERMLEIMKDSCAGPMGVVAIILLLLCKFVLLLSLPAAWRVQALILMPTCGRCATALISSSLPYARAEGGTAAFTQEHNASSRLLIAWACLVASAVILCGLWSGIVIILSVVVATRLLGRYYKRKIGGYTGDTLGATSELVELVPALMMIILVQHGVL